MNWFFLAASESRLVACHPILREGVAKIIVYTTSWCGDCRRTKQFLLERGVEFQEVNIDETPAAEELVLRVNNGRRKVPTIEVEGHYFVCSPFDPYTLSEVLKVPLNP